MSGKKVSLGEAFRQTWPLWALATFVVLSVVVLYLVPGGQPKADATSTLVQVEMHTNLGGAPRTESLWAKPSKEENARAAIEEYIYQIEHDANGPETADNLFRVANLYYSTLLDYEKASLYYVALIQDHPEHSGVRIAFPNLITCYERLGKDDFRRNTLRDMMAFYGEGTEEYRFAEQQLTGQ